MGKQLKQVLSIVSIIFAIILTCVAITTNHWFEMASPVKTISDLPKSFVYFWKGLYKGCLHIPNVVPLQCKTLKDWKMDNRRSQILLLLFILSWSFLLLLLLLFLIIFFVVFVSVVFVSSYFGLFFNLYFVDWVTAVRVLIYISISSGILTIVVTLIMKVLLGRILNDIVSILSFTSGKFY